MDDVTLETTDRFEAGFAAATRQEAVCASRVSGIDEGRRRHWPAPTRRPGKPHVRHRSGRHTTSSPPLPRYTVKLAILRCVVLSRYHFTPRSAASLGGGLRGEISIGVKSNLAPCYRGLIAHRFRSYHDCAFAQVGQRCPIVRSAVRLALAPCHPP